MRCSPVDVIKAGEALSPEAREKVQKLGFGNLLKISLNKLSSRGLVMWLMDKIDPDSMVINIKSGMTLSITPDVVHLVLGIPHGDGENVLPFEYKEQLAETTKLRADLKAQKKLISIPDVLEVIKNSKDIELQVRCFLLILFNRLLLPTTSYYIGGKEIMMTKDLEKIGRIDWCNVVYEDLKRAIYLWKDGSITNKTKKILGCAVFLIVSIFITFLFVAIYRFCRPFYC